MRTTTKALLYSMVLMLTTACGSSFHALEKVSPEEGVSPIEFEPMPETTPIPNVPVEVIPTPVESPVVSAPAATPIPALPSQDLPPVVVTEPTPVPPVEPPTSPVSESPEDAEEVPAPVKAPPVIEESPVPTPQPAAPSPEVAASSIELSLDNAYQAYGKITLATLEAMSKLYMAQSPVPMTLAMSGQTIKARLEQATCQYVSGSNESKQATFKCQANIAGDGFYLGNKVIEINLKGIDNEPTHILLAARLLN